MIDLDRSMKASDLKGNRRRIRTNAMINAKMVKVEALRDRRTYALIEGKI